jgi:hypothetical protein
VFVQKVITDVFAEVGAFGIGIEKVLKFLRREVEVTINLAAVGSQIEPSALNNVSRRLNGSCDKTRNIIMLLNRSLHPNSRAAVAARVRLHG